LPAAAGPCRLRCSSCSLLFVCRVVPQPVFDLVDQAQEHTFVLSLNLLDLDVTLLERGEGVRVGRPRQTPGDVVIAAQVLQEIPNLLDDVAVANLPAHSSSSSSSHGASPALSAA